MKMNRFLRGVTVAAAPAIATIASHVAETQVLPTGATITPSTAPGSGFQPLKVALPDYPNYTPDGAETTAVSNISSGANLSHTSTPQPETRQVSGKAGLTN